MDFGVLGSQSISSHTVVMRFFGDRISGGGTQVTFSIDRPYMAVERVTANTNSIALLCGIPNGNSDGVIGVDKGGAALDFTKSLFIVDLNCSTSKVLTYPSYVEFKLEDALMITFEKPHMAFSIANAVVSHGVPYKPSRFQLCDGPASAGSMSTDLVRHNTGGGGGALVVKEEAGKIAVLETRLEKLEGLVQTSMEMSTEERRDMKSAMATMTEFMGAVTTKLDEVQSDQSEIRVMFARLQDQQKRARKFVEELDSRDTKTARTNGGAGGL